MSLRHVKHVLDACERIEAPPTMRHVLTVCAFYADANGAMAGGTKNIGDVDVKEAAGVIAANIDESVIDEIVLPMFAASRVYCIENKKFIKGETDIDQCFTVDTLFDFYELVFLVARFQFAPFFQTLAGRFGNLIDAPKTQKSPASSKTK